MTTSLRARASAFALPAVLLLVAAGCRSGAKTYPVSGRVEFPDGRPLTVGRVEFLSTAGPTKGRIAHGDIGPDGAFRLDHGAVEGPHQVIVVTPMTRETQHDERRPPKLLIEPRFQVYARSGLTVTVEPGRNAVVLRVQGPGQKPR